VLYLAGRDRKDAIETALADAFAVEIVEAYAAEARETWSLSEAQSLASCVGALHYSRRSAELAAALAKAAGGETRFLDLNHVCISRDVAESLQALGAKRVAIAKTPDEAGLFRRLREELGGFPSLGSSRI
jgi:uroporphyrinogen-III synthase